MPYTYILECADGSYYCGSTWDVDGRVWQHNNSELGAVYTRRRRPVRLVWSQYFDSIKDAYECEKQIQNWSRKKRQALISGRVDLLPDLSRRRDRQTGRVPEDGG